MSWFSKKSGDKADGDQKPVTGAAKKAAKSNGAAPNGAAKSAAMTQEEVQNSLARSRRTLASLGELVAVMMSSPQHQNMTLAQLRKFVGPAIATGQYLVASAHNKLRGAATPVAAVVWANVSADVDRRLGENLDQPLTLKAEEWTSGQIPWLVAAVGDQRMIQHLVATVQQKSLKGRTLKARVTGDDGKPTVRTFSTAPSSPAGATAAKAPPPKSTAQSRRPEKAVH